MSLDAIKNEVELLKNLQSRYIIQFYGVHYLEDEVRLVTDYAEHGSLKHLIDRKLLTDWKVKMRIAQEIAKGLAYIHYNKIYHRDLKSANVLLTSRNEVKLCDFGLASIIGLAEPSASVTAQGTFRWMAPELLDGKPQYSTKSDVYALGMVMWEMAAMSTFPFRGLSDSAVKAAVLSGKHEQLSGSIFDFTSNDTRRRTTSHIPDNYRHWIERCWEHDPAKRPEAHEVVLVNFAQKTPFRASVFSTISNSSTAALSHFLGTKCASAYENITRASLLTHTLPKERGFDRQYLELNHPLRITDYSVVDVQFSSNSLYEKGNDVAKKISRRIFGRIPHEATADHLEAMNHIGERYSDSLGSERNNDEATRWDRFATEQEPPVERDDAWNPLQNSKAHKRRDSKTFSRLRRSLQKGYFAARHNPAAIYGADRATKKDGKELVAQIRQAAERGDPRAQFSLGEMYRLGQGVIHIDTEAVKWYTMAADQGELNAQCNLGTMYKLGQGVKQSDTDAVEWYTMAAMQGNPKAQFNLALMHEHGYGVSKSNTEAVRWYTMAAIQGDPKAQLNLGVMYRQGRGVARSDTEAFELYTMAAKQGETKAQFNLGLMHRLGQGAKRSDNKTVKWYTKAANHGDSDAQFNLGEMYRHGHGVKQRHTRAFKWYTMAAKQGDPRAQCNIGEMYRLGQGVQQSDAEAFKWYTVAALQGEPNGQFNLGLMHELGRGVIQSNTEAIRWYTMAANQREPNAQCNLAEMYRLGQGVEQSDSKAVKWYTTVANQGEPKAQNNLGVMYRLGRGVEQSDIEAVKWYTMAATPRRQKGQNNHETAYENGHGVKQSDVESFRWCTMSSNQGYSKSQLSLGMSASLI
ncbi:hypothetical protein BGW41_001817 [Actinomortierella wolfii]|nr:hypothetical protein BGW41_001817 [Actinomortierella wolfii]